MCLRIVDKHRDTDSEADVVVSFPLVVGLSLGDRYEGTGSEDDSFGFAAVGAKAAVPSDIDESWGGWMLNTSAVALFLGDAASTFNDDDDAEFIGTVGVSVSFQIPGRGHVVPAALRKLQARSSRRLESQR
jgi:hypothetical protein